VAPTAAEGGRAELTVEQILAWADAHHAAHGAWPEAGFRSGGGLVDAAPGETWNGINYALAMGLRGLPGDSSLAELLAEHRGLPAPDLGPKALAEKLWAWEQEHFPTRGPRIRIGKKLKPSLPPRSIPQILAWADAHHAATAEWPNARSGKVRDACDENWRTIDKHLRTGCRGLPGGQSLARLFAEQRGVRNCHSQKPLTIEQILGWIDAHHAAHGHWPRLASGPVDGAPGETWAGINIALRKGLRGLPGGTTLARLLIEHRGPDAHSRPRALTVEQVLAWAAAFRAAHGRWPRVGEGAVDGAPGETWNAIHLSLERGLRGLPAGLSLARLLARERGHRNLSALPRLTIEQILAWADAYHAAHGRWPTACSGPITGAPGETWRAVSLAMYNGGRGLSQGVTLPQLLQQYRGHRNISALPRQTIEQILAWADAYHGAHGRWPTNKSGPIASAPGESWAEIDDALSKGRRGLIGGTTLARLLAQHRGHRYRLAPPALTLDQIVGWAEAHHAAHGRWPHSESGPISGAPGETWAMINYALVQGRRGLAGGATLARLLAAHRRASQPVRERP
jgi:hypothetical protein